MKPFALSVVTVLLAFAPFAAYAETTEVPQTRQQITFSFAPLVKQVAPAVVNIYAQKKVQQRVMSPLLDDPFFRRFFEGTMPPGFSRQRLENSLGSGVIIKPNGLIVTSNHVIDGADQIRVVLADRREFDATVVLADDRSDLAVLRIETKGEVLPYLELKDSDEAQVGDLVLALGDPFGVGQTVTSGIISATARTAVGTSDLNYFIQTDAAINPGNSGGALVTMDGKLVGINSAIYSRDGGNLGIGFAVPSNMVRVVLNGVAQGAKALVHPWTGIEGQEVTAELGASLAMAQPKGMLVNRTYPDSPAAKAGLRAGDVIVSVNGRAVDDPESFRYRITTLPVGSSTELGVVRKGEKLTINVQLIAPPENPPRDKTEITGRNPLTGATLANLSPAVAEEIGMREASQGVIVLGVKDDTLAANLGIQPGDIILRVNDAKIATVAEAVAAMKVPARGWHIAIQRGGSTLNIMVGGG
jgi:serine protease Do